MCVEISHIHSDNVIFSSDKFRLGFDNKQQEQSFSGVGSKDKNARAEKAVQNIMYMARTFMVHSSLHWKYHRVDDISIWSFAVNHAVWLHNRLPNYRSGITLLDFLTGK